MAKWIAKIVVLLLLPMVSRPSGYAPRHLAGYKSEQSGELQATAVKQECPTWFTGNRSSGCECCDVPGVMCQSNRALVLISSCVTFDADRKELLVASCPFGIALDKTRYVNYLYIRLPDSSSDVNEYFCAGLNRTGAFCSKCQTGLGPPVLSYSFKCVHCLPSPYGWLLYVFLACFPTTVFSLLVFLFQVRANSPQLNIIVLAFQYLALIQVSDSQGSRELLADIVTTFYSLWNLEFFRYSIPPFCISKNMSLVDVYALEYLVATFPLFLVVLIYVSVELHARGCKVLVCLWKPFTLCCTHTQRWMDPRHSFVNVFATLLMLSYSKLVMVSIHMLQYTQFFSNYGEQLGPKVVYLDASMHYLTSNYIPYMILSSSIVVFLVALPVIFLCLYPLRSFQRCLNSCGLSWHALHAFADSFNGHYKSRTDNTYDCRYFGSFYMAFRIVIFLAFIIGGRYVWLVQITMGVVTMFLFTSLRPYKDDIFNIINSFIIGVWTISVLVGLYGADMIADVPLRFFYAVGLIPLIYFVVLVKLKLLVRTKLYHSHFVSFHRARNLIERFIGYQNTDNGGTGTNRGVSDLPHRLMYPAQYRPASYGTFASSVK